VILTWPCTVPSQLSGDPRRHRLCHARLVPSQAGAKIAARRRST